MGGVELATQIWSSGPVDSVTVSVFNIGVGFCGDRVSCSIWGQHSAFPTISAVLVLRPVDDDLTNWPFMGDIMP